MLKRNEQPKLILKDLPLGRKVYFCKAHGTFTSYSGICTNCGQGGEPLRQTEDGTVIYARDFV